eukprot:6194846-Pleurochrysis_carterae.AAC.2
MDWAREVRQTIERRWGNARGRTAVAACLITIVFNSRLHTDADACSLLSLEEQSQDDRPAFCPSVTSDADSFSSRMTSITFACRGCCCEVRVHNLQINLAGVPARKSRKERTQIQPGQEARSNPDKKQAWLMRLRPLVFLTFPNYNVFTHYQRIYYVRTRTMIFHETALSSSVAQSFSIRRCTKLSNVQNHGTKLIQFGIMSIFTPWNDCSETSQPELVVRGLHLSCRSRQRSS